jgi:hypothetical protein
MTTETPSYLSSLDAEVQFAANQASVEVILFLIQKWEWDLEMKSRMGRLEIPDLLRFYVNLKISIHHLRKAFDGGWTTLSADLYNKKYVQLNNKIKEARKDYYVAKLRYDSNEHGDECSCRGCRCVKGIEQRG